ncbi:MAG: AI-2E family transporter [Rhodocyclaceae bacterium]|nr:AI-2E family transporter [Rhodocyclaceae bacterium]
MTNSDAMPAARVQQAAWFIAALLLLLVLRLHLLPSLLSGLLVFELVHVLASLLAGRLSNRRAKIAAVLVLAVLVIGGMALGTVLAVGFFNHHGGGLAALAQKMADTIDNARLWLPDWMLAMLPEGVDSLKSAAAAWLREHAGEVGGVGKEAGIAFVHVLVGMVIGAMVALHEAASIPTMRPLAAALSERARRLAQAFRRIVFAQVRIAALNTCFTALYLAVALPLADVHLPLTKTMIALTFVVGLLPVAGNLISNTVIVVVSLALSPQVALASLAFLIVIHKLEYFLNARIVGSQIAAEAWELLLAMLAMEAAFGVSGLVAAPIYYAYVKSELAAAGLV